MLGGSWHNPETPTRREASLPAMRQPSWEWTGTGAPAEASESRRRRPLQALTKLLRFETNLKDHCCLRSFGVARYTTDSKNRISVQYTSTETA